MAEAVAAVIFDCDGVLVDSERIAARMIGEALSREGWAMSADEAEARFVGGTMAGIVEQAVARLPNLDGEAFAERAYAEMFAALARVEKISGVDAVLDALDAGGLPYAIGSNGPHEKMDVTLGATGLKPRFEGRIFSARDFARPKPFGDMFLAAAERLGAPPARCLVVGDSKNDALAAEAAGMRFCGYDHRRPSALFDGLAVDHVHDLVETLSRIGLAKPSAKP